MKRLLLVGRGRTIAWVLVGVILGGTSAAYGAAKFKKEQIPQISAYCSTVQEPQVSYGPCPVTGKSIASLLGGGGEFSSIAIGADGFPVISHHDPGSGALKVTRCADIACTGKSTTTTLATGGAGEYSSIAIGADNLPVISYRHNDLVVAKCTNAACSSATFSTVATDFAVEWTSIAIGAEGNPVISYRTDSFKLWVAKCNDPACAGGDETRTTVDSLTGHDYGAYSSIAVRPDGNPIVAYRDAPIGDASLKVASCNDAACSTAATKTILDTGFDMGHFSVAIGTDGKPVISYYNGGNQTLRVVKCDDAACAPGGETITTIDAQNSGRGKYTSIAIGTNGNPVVAYYDDNADALRFASCSNPACTGSATKTIVDNPANDVGIFTSTAIGIDGDPIISYRDATANALKVARVSH